MLSRRIIVNLAPANTKKEGSIFDLPIAVGILIASQNIQNVNIQQKIQDTIFIGELSLDGTIEKTNGILPICIEAKKLGIKKIILPMQNAKEGSVVNGIEILPVNNLKEVIHYLNEEYCIPKEPVSTYKIKQIENDEFDFSEVKGQEEVKRALEIAAAGGHNCLLIGSPGSRKNNVSEKITKYSTRD